MNIKGKDGLFEYTKRRLEWTYWTHEAKGHEIPVALDNIFATGGSNSAGATKFFQQG